MTLIDKLNEHKEAIAALRGTEKQGSREFIFLGHHLLGFQTAIDIVKEHSVFGKVFISTIKNPLVMHYHVGMSILITIWVKMLTFLNTVLIVVVKLNLVRCSYETM